MYGPSSVRPEQQQQQWQLGGRNYGEINRGETIGSKGRETGPAPKVGEMPGQDGQSHELQLMSVPSLAILASIYPRFSQRQAAGARLTPCE